MPANATLYLPAQKIDLKEIIPDARAAGGLFNRKSVFEIPIEGTSVRLNVMPADRVEKHLHQFTAYIDSLDDSEAAKRAARLAVGKSKTVLGLQTSLEFAECGELPLILERIIEHYQGCIFIFDSVVRPGGEVIVGPLKSASTE